VDVQRQLPRGVAAAVIVRCTIKKACPTGSNARITVQTIEIAVEIVPIHFTDRTIEIETITHIIRIILGRKIKVGTEEILAAGSEAVGETTSVVVSVTGEIGNVTIEQLPRGVAAAKGEALIVKKACPTDNEVHITGLIIEIIAASMDEAIPTAIT